MGASPDVVCRAFLDRMEAIRRSNAMTCKDFLDPKLIPEDVRAFCKFSGIEALRGCRFGVECINSYLRTTPFHHPLELVSVIPSLKLSSVSTVKLISSALLMEVADRSVSSRYQASWLILVSPSPRTL